MQLTPLDLVPATPPAPVSKIEVHIVPSEAPRIEDPTWECCGSDAYVAGKLAFPER